MNGLLITLEGVEGSGKSTQIKLLSEKLIDAGYSVTTTKEPGGTSIGSRIRQLLLDPASGEMDPRAELLLYAADRAQDVRENIAPALERGQIVLVDRYLDSNIAYQGYGRQLDLEMVKQINYWVIGDYLPDLTLVLDIDVKKGVKRARDLANDRLDQEVIEFHRRVRDAYQEMARQDRFALVNADRDPEAVSREIFNTIKGRLL